MHRSISRQSFSSELQVIEKFFNAFLIKALYINDGMASNAADDIRATLFI